MTAAAIIKDDVLPVVTAADAVKGPEQGKWTYADYAAIPADGRRYEIVEGVLYMSPSPSPKHQLVCGNIHADLRTFVRERKLGQVFIAPLDVELSPGTVVQPDVLVVLERRREIITPTRIIGAPDLVVEVASPGTQTHDRSRKLIAYAEGGVPECWLADPDAETVELLILAAEQKEYRSQGVFRGGAVFPSVVIPDFDVPVRLFFEQ